MKPVLIIPTYSRPNGKAIYRCKNLNIQKYLFIRPEQKDLYSMHKPEYKIILQRDGTDIGKVRKNIVNWCQNQGIEWAFVFDDDISKVEFLAQKNGQINSKRLLCTPHESPRIEIDALKYWYKMAKKKQFSLSTVVYRFSRRYYGKLIENGCHCMQCVLLHVPDIAEVGNYKSVKDVGAEDMYIQYLLMSKGYKTGCIGCIEYDCPPVGKGKGGNNAVECNNLQQRYTEYVNTFLNNVCNDESLIKVKETRIGIPSIKFKWESWGISKKSINLEEVT